METRSSERQGLLATIGWALVRFCLAAVFGLFVSAVLAALWIWFLGFDEGVDELWLTLLWLTPILWGVLGIGYYDRALALARRIFEAYFTSRWW